MNAFALIDALETPLHEKPIFPVEPRDKGLASEKSRQAAFRRLLHMTAPGVGSWGVPNASKRGFIAQRNAKLEGLTAGVFDEHYVWNHGIAFLEWKKGDGALDQAQIDWGNAMHRMGFRVACVRTPEFAHRLFAEWGAPVRAIHA